MEEAMEEALVSERALRLATEIHESLSKAFKGGQNYCPTLLGLALAHHVWLDKSMPEWLLATQAARVWCGQDKPLPILAVRDGIRSAMRHRINQIISTN
jgi:hypothetical protein